MTIEQEIESLNKQVEELMTKVEEMSMKETDFKKQLKKLEEALLIRSLIVLVLFHIASSIYRQ